MDTPRPRRNKKELSLRTGRVHSGALYYYRGPTGTRTQGLSLPVRQLSYLANGRPLIFSPCLIRFVPESARNNGGTTKHALFDARYPSREPTLSHQMSQGRKKIVARPGLEPRASRYP